MLRLVVVAGCAAGCVVDHPPEPAPEPATATAEQAAIVCGRGDTVLGIDVSMYQGQIDWNRVAGAGIAYAFIRAFDGVTADPMFDTNWAASRSAGVMHGAYQFFRASRDPIEQADALLAKLMPFAPDDLPPVIDIDGGDGRPRAEVAAAVRRWVDHVTAAIGRPPIIYAGFFTWRDDVGGPDLTSSLLWHPQYTTAECPNIAEPWQDWAFWQYSSTGRVDGITGDVDLNRFNGNDGDLLDVIANRYQPRGTPNNDDDGGCSAGAPSGAPSTLLLAALLCAAHRRIRPRRSPR